MDYIIERNNLERALKTIDKIAEDINVPSSHVALQIVKNKRQQIEDYIASHGVMPALNPASLAVQATLLHEGKIHAKMSSGISNYMEAENSVIQDGIDFYRNNLTSNFMDGSLLGGVLSAGKAGIDKINEKRSANGKKEILSGKFWQMLKTKVGDKVDVQRDAGGYHVTVKAPQVKGEIGADIEAGLQAARNSIISSEKKAWLKKNKYYIAMTAALLIFVILYLRKK